MSESTTNNQEFDTPAARVNGITDHNEVQDINWDYDYDDYDYDDEEEWEEDDDEQPPGTYCDELCEEDELEEYEPWPWEEYTAPPSDLKYDKPRIFIVLDRKSCINEIEDLYVVPASNEGAYHYYDDGILKWYGRPWVPPHSYYWSTVAEIPLDSPAYIITRTRWYFVNENGGITERYYYSSSGYIIALVRDMDVIASRLIEIGVEYSILYRGSRYAVFHVLADEPTVRMQFRYGW